MWVAQNRPEAAALWASCDSKQEAGTLALDNYLTTVCYIKYI